MVVREISGITMQRSSRETRWSFTWFPQPSRPSRFKLMISLFVFSHEFKCDQMQTPYTTFGYFLYLCMAQNTLQSIDDEFQSVYCLLRPKPNNCTNFAVVLSGSTITKGCQAKTKHPISMCAHAWMEWESGGNDTRNSVAKRCINRSTALWRPYFCNHLRIYIWE